MRLLRAATAVLAAGVVTGAAAAALISEQRSASFDAGAGRLQRTWAHDLAVGVPATGIAALRTELRTQSPQGGWWSPAWWSSDGSALLARLDRGTASAYATAMSSARARAQAVLAAGRQEVSADRAWLPAATAAAVTGWGAQLAAATTPARLDSLAAAWQAQLTTNRATVLAAQQRAEQRQLQAGVAAAGGPPGLITEAGQDVARAHGDNLDPGDVPTLAAQLESEVRRGGATSQTADTLLLSLQQLDQLFALNGRLDAAMRPLELLADQAAAEGAPDADAYVAAYRGIDQAFLAGTTYAALDPLQAQLTALQAQITAALSADRCGHRVGSGKVITISISLQEMVMYDNGCVVNATPVTTGRPGFATPTGSFHVFYKTHPFEMISSYPYGSAGWYPPTWVQWVMEFDWGGYFIHDAYWEAQDAFGPGSQDAVAQDYASHGCVHVPNALMPWLYSWTPLGTPVVITR